MHPTYEFSLTGEGRSRYVVSGCLTSSPVSMMFLFPGKIGCLFAVSDDSDNEGETDGRRLVEDLIESGGPVEMLQNARGRVSRAPSSTTKAVQVPVDGLLSSTMYSSLRGNSGTLVLRSSAFKKLIVAYSDMSSSSTSDGAGEGLAFRAPSLGIRNSWGVAGDSAAVDMCELCTKTERNEFESTCSPDEPWAWLTVLANGVAWYPLTSLGNQCDSVRLRTVEVRFKWLSQRSGALLTRYCRAAIGEMRPRVWRREIRPRRQANQRRPFRPDKREDCAGQVEKCSKE